MVGSKHSQLNTDELQSNYKVVFAWLVKLRGINDSHFAMEGMICSQHALPVALQPHHHLVYPVAMSSSSFPIRYHQVM